MNDLTLVMISDSLKMFACTPREVSTGQSLIVCFSFAMVRVWGFDVRAAAKVYFESISH